MTPETIQRLSALHNRLTRYEVAAVNGEQRLLIGYTVRHSRHGLLDACRSRGQQIIDAFGITDQDMFIPAKKAADGFTIGSWQFRFTGRTERDAILEGELRDISTLAANSWEAYDHAAEDLARKGLTGAVGDPLPINMDTATVALINADPEAFETRVRSFAYALAMEAIEPKSAEVA